MENCDPRFEPLLGKFDNSLFELCEAPVYGMWPDFTLSYLNPAWFVFAASNGGEPEISRNWGLGVDMLQAIDEPLRSYYRTAMLGCLDDGKPWGHQYECPTTTLHREYHMRVYPLQLDRGFLVVHSKVREHQHDLEAHRPADAVPDLYTDQQGRIVQCMHCRCIQRADGSGQWDWVPVWVERYPPNMTGSLCRPCYAHYFGSKAANAS